MGDTKTFKNSEERIAYAWSLHHQKEITKAEMIFKDMDVRFSNYKHRLEYGQFLIENKREEEAKVHLSYLLEEINHMDRVEQRSKKQIIRTIRNLHDQI